MEDPDFDRLLVDAAFRLAGQDGWPRMRVARAARAAGLPLDRARARFPGRGAILLAFGRMADQAALATAAAEGDPRDRLFDLFMQRLEFLQAHRPGVLALFRALPADPPLAVLLAAASRCSIAWLLEAAGIDITGIDGALRTSGGLAVWLWAVRAWREDESADLSTTMTTLDRALSRAEQAAGWLRRGAPPPMQPDADSPPDAPAESLPVVLPENPPPALS
jgi:AcrR family transcriptional regulator